MSRQNILNKDSVMEKLTKLRSLPTLQNVIQGYYWRQNELKAGKGPNYNPTISEVASFCGLTKKVADMQTCGLKQFKLRTCGCGLFLILVRNFASFIQILKFLSIFVKYLCFYPVKHEKSIKIFRVQVRQKYQVFRVQADINTKSAFQLNCFLIVDMLFGYVRNKYMPSSHLLCK